MFQSLFYYVILIYLLIHTSESEASEKAVKFDAAECSRARKLNNVCDKYQVSYSNQMLCSLLLISNMQHNTVR